ncbi:hypothetical protein Q8A67_021799 [Cirrhinus molitorella]|uniref:Secreted protein n=1 Tax=Cirrhinus molitorella TaxID=172907 RepID=A0AA88TES3_9TELE|nr:hypothetical protein Q8A67_021799 [Cirrhinus molitorella]
MGAFIIVAWFVLLSDLQILCESVQMNRLKRIIDSLKGCSKMKSMQCYTHIHNSEKRPFVHKEPEWTSCWVGLEIVCPTIKDNELIHITAFHVLFSIHVIQEHLATVSTTGDEQ